MAGRREFPNETITALSGFQGARSPLEERLTTALQTGPSWDAAEAAVVTA